MKDVRTLAEKARDSIVPVAVLAARAPSIHRMGPQELEAFAGLVRAAVSDLNSAHQLIQRLIRQQNKGGAAGAALDASKHEGE